MFYQGEDQNTAATSNKETKERALESQLKDPKQNKIAKQIIPIETEGMFTKAFINFNTTYGYITNIVFVSSN